LGTVIVRSLAEMVPDMELLISFTIDWLCNFVFFFKQKTAYEIGLGIPAEPLFRSYCSRRFGGATCDDKSAQIYARFDKNDWRIQPAEFYRFHDAEVNTFGYF